MLRPSFFRAPFVFGLLAVISDLSPLERWGAIWAIVAGVIASIAFLGGLATWLWQQAAGSDLRHGLSPGYADPILNVDTEQGVVSADVGVELTNVKDFPLRYETEKFTVTIGDFVSTYVGSWASEIHAKLQVGFWRDPIEFRLDQVVSPIVIDYRFLYGKPNREPRRFIEGQHRCPIAVPAGFLQPGTVAAIPVVHRSEPTKDGRLPVLRPLLLKLRVVLTRRKSMGQ